MDGNVPVGGPAHRKVSHYSMHNFDVYDKGGDNLILFEGDTEDRHSDVHDMCLIDAVCVEHGVFKENKNG